MKVIYVYIELKSFNSVESLDMGSVAMKTMMVKVPFGSLARSNMYVIKEYKTLYES